MFLFEGVKLQIQMGIPYLELRFGLAIGFVTEVSKARGCHLFSFSSSPGAFDAKDILGIERVILVL